MLRRLAFSLLLLIAAAALAGLGVAVHYVRQWDAIISERFRTHHWDFPSKIYSDSQLIYPGMDLKAVGFFDRLHDLDYQPVTTPVERNGDYRIDEHAGTIDVYLRDLPTSLGDTDARRVRLDVTGNTVTRITDLDDQTKEIYAIDLEPALLSGLYQGAWEERHIVSLD